MLLVSPEGPITIALGLYPKLPYNPLRDLAPITQLIKYANVLVVNPTDLDAALFETRQRDLIDFDPHFDFIAAHIATKNWAAVDIGPTTAESTHYPKHGEAAARLVASTTSRS